MSVAEGSARAESVECIQGLARYLGVPMSDPGWRRRRDEVGYARRTLLVCVALALGVSANDITRATGLDKSGVRGIRARLERVPVARLARFGRAWGSSVGALSEARVVALFARIDALAPTKKRRPAPRANKAKKAGVARLKSGRAASARERR